MLNVARSTRSRVLLFGCIGFGCVSASALALTQPPVGLGALALVALVPWIRASQRCNLVAAMLLGAATGTVYGCLVASWIPEALRSLGSSWPTSVAGLVFTAAWSKTAMFAVLGGVLCASARTRAWTRVAVASGTLFALEWIVSMWRLGVPWGLVGHSQIAVLGVAQLASVAGVPLVSAFLMGTNVAVAELLRERSLVGPGARLATAFIAAWAVLALLGVSAATALRPEARREEGATTELLLVQPDLPREERWGLAYQHDNLERVASYVDGVLSDAKRRPSVLVLPENLLTYPVDRKPVILDAVQAWVDRIGLPVITGLAMAPEVRDAQLYRNAVVWLDPGRGVTARIDKVRAIPLLESSRAVIGASLLAPLYGAASAWKKVEEAEEAGPLQGSFTVTPVLCYEALFPGLVARRRTDDSVAILNLADDGWVTGDTATRQLTAFATFRAIEQRLTFVRVAHGGLSVVVDPFGRTLQTLPMDAFASARVRLHPMPPPSPEEEIALLALPIGSGFGVWWGFGALTQRGRSR